MLNRTQMEMKDKGLTSQYEVGRESSVLSGEVLVLMLGLWQPMIPCRGAAG